MKNLWLDSLVIEPLRLAFAKQQLCLGVTIPLTEKYTIYTLLFIFIYLFTYFLIYFSPLILLE